MSTWLRGVLLGENILTILNKIADRGLFWKRFIFARRPRLYTFSFLTIHNLFCITKKGRVTVTHPKKDIPLGTLKSIEKQAGVKFS